jgi:2-haloacid dehalogenase
MTSDETASSPVSSSLFAVGRRMNQLPRAPLLRDALSNRRRETLARQVALAAGPPIGAVVFDAYGTLFDLAAIERACAAILPEPAPFVALWRAKQLEYSWLRALMDTYADFDQITAEALDHALAQYALRPTASVRSALLAAWRDLESFPDVADAFVRLSGLPLAILSNGIPDALAALLARNELVGAFAAVLSADSVGRYKPQSEVYALAPAALDLPIARILFVSANGWDAVGAQAYGFPVAWCNRAGRTPETHGPAPTLEVRDLGQLAEALGR